ncbi:MAG: MetQ/NlpA family ABC transporter substrate-binding protein [Endozoicomonadaceae bacterium]|nr:MetQ/NlpA family ABC transporter substrate-binding protein [Endozoicomonadaceae bacterium]
MMLAVLWSCQRTDMPKHFRIGAIAGPEAELIQTVIQVAKSKFNLDCELVIFQDYNTPNRFLIEGEIDLNAYQHEPYLQQVIQAKNIPLVVVGKTFIYPMGAYSKKIKHIHELNMLDTISIPNDPSNGSRALKLLEKSGLIRLKDPLSYTSTPMDIIENKKNLKIITLDAAQLPRSLSDVAVSVITSTFAASYGYIPSQDAILLENKESPYVNIVVARQDNHTDERIEKFMQAFHDEIVIEKAQQLFKGSVIQGW